MILAGLQVIIFAMGVTSIVKAVRYAWFFSKSDHHIAGSMKAMLMEQVTSSAGTLYFSANSLVTMLAGVPEDEWNSIDPSMAIAIRMIMFGMMIRATEKMSNSVKLVIRQHEVN